VIKSGLEAGEIVSLAPPLDSAGVKITRLDISDETASNPEDQKEKKRS
jgi:hypothetical protein